MGNSTGYHTYEMHSVFYVVKFQQHRRANRMMNGTHDRAFTIPSCAYNSLNPNSWVMLFECLYAAFEAKLFLIMKLIVPFDDILYLPINSE